MVENINLTSEVFKGLPYHGNGKRKIKCYKTYIFSSQNWGERKPVGENLKVVSAEFSNLSWAASGKSIIHRHLK